MDKNNNYKNPLTLEEGSSQNYPYQCEDWTGPSVYRKG